MGIAALAVAGLMGLVVAIAVVYGTCLGLYRGGRFLWRLLVPEESGEATSGMAEDSSVSQCWQDKDCPAALRDTCPAYKQKEHLPCWLAILRGEGRLRVNCLTCQRFDVADLVA